MGDFRAGLVSGIAGNKGMLLGALKSKDRSLRQLLQGSSGGGGDRGCFCFYEGGVRFFLLRLMGR